MNDAEVRDKLKNGWIRGVVTFEVAGKPAEHVEKSLEEYTTNLKKDDRIIILEEHKEEVMEHEDGMFSALSELEILAKNLEVYTWVSVNFSPASIEILEPSQISIKGADLTNWLNDLLAKLHEISLNFREMKGTSNHLIVAMNQLIKNAVLLSLKTGAKTSAQIQKDTGINGAEIEKFLSNMVEKGQIVQMDETYTLA